MSKRKEAESRPFNRRLPDADPSTSCGAKIDTISQDLEDMQLESRSQLLFLDLPPEIRNKIYEWTYILSRDRDDTYNSPDFQIHGDDKTGGGIRWMNIPRFNLLLVNKQIYHEAIPIIASEMFLEVKTYRMGDQRALTAMTSLHRASEFCQKARRVIINLTPGHGDWASGMIRIASELFNYSKLEELTLRIMVYNKKPEDMWLAAPLFEIARGNKSSLCVELIDLEADRWLKATIKAEHKLIEKTIYKMARKIIGKNSEVWIEWTNLSETEMHTIFGSEWDA